MKVSFINIIRMIVIFSFIAGFIFNVFGAPFWLVSICLSFPAGYGFADALIRIGDGDD